MPTSARIFVDDKRVDGNPFKGKLAKNGVTHTIRAEAEGDVEQRAERQLRLGETGNAVQLRLPVVGGGAGAVAVVEAVEEQEVGPLSEQLHADDIGDRRCRPVGRQLRRPVLAGVLL